MKETRYKDTDLREALRRKYADTPQLPADFMANMEQQMVKDAPTVRRWRWVAAAAVAMLLCSVSAVFYNRHSEQPALVAQTDSTKATPQTVIKKAEERPVETADSIKQIKQRYRPRPPKHYMAKAEPAVILREQDPVNVEELAERAIAEEKRQMEMEMIAASQANSSLQADFESMTKEIRQRGERMSQHVEIAMSDED